MEKQRFEHAKAMKLAESMQELLAIYAKSVDICGSLRRHMTFVSDIELVVCLNSEAENLANAQMELDGGIEALIAEEFFSYDPVTKRNGQKYKRFVCRNGGSPIGVDVFICNLNNRGNTLAIRTGDADFSRYLVTHRDKGGLMPTDLVQKDGYLWRRDFSVDPAQIEDTPLSCPTEEEFFRVIGVPFVQPHLRNTFKITELRRAFRSGF